MPPHSRTFCLEFFGQARTAIPCILEIKSFLDRRPDGAQGPDRGAVARRVQDEELALRPRHLYENATPRRRSQPLREHLGRWAPAFARRLARTTTNETLHTLAEFAREFISMDCTRFGLTPGSGKHRNKMLRTKTLFAPLQYGQQKPSGHRTLTIPRRPGSSVEKRLFWPSIDAEAGHDLSVAVVKREVTGRRRLGDWHRIVILGPGHAVFCPRQARS